MIEFLTALLSFGAWLLSTLLSLLVSLLVMILRVALVMVRGVLMLLPDPATMPGLPLVEFPFSVGWLAVLVDFGAISNLIQFMVTVEMTFLVVSIARWLWGWVKW